MLTSKSTIDGLPVTELKPNSYKRVTLKCNSCGTRTETTWQNYICGLKRNNETTKTFCKKCGVTKAALKRRGKPSPSRGIARPAQRGSNNPRWKGGRYLDVHGYVMVLTTPGRAHSDSGWHGYHREHIIVAEQKLRRLLIPGEIVHHIDGNRSNNSKRNLWVATHATHRVAHQSLQEIGYQMVQKQLLSFDQETGRYTVAHAKLRELLEQP